MRTGRTSLKRQRRFGDDFLRWRFRLVCDSADRCSRIPPLEVAQSMGSAREGTRTMKFTLHVTVLTVLLVLVFATALGLGWNAYRNARFTADDLSAQILDQASLRVDNEINDL